MNFRQLLDNTFEFDFVDAPYASTPATGVELFYAPPYYSFYDPDLESIKKAHRWLLDYVDEHGPYDGVMNFSQGCALSSTLLLYHQKFHPDKPPPFKVAMFICGGIVLSALDDLGFVVSEEAKEIDEKSKVQLLSRASTEAILKDGSNRWGVGFDPLSQKDKSNIFGFNFENIPKDRMIQIPTVHVYGAKDPRYPSSITLAQFCKASVRKTYDHGGGHDIPRTRDVNIAMAELVEWCGMMADSR